MFIEFIKLAIYIILIIVISKYMLVKLLRNIAETLNLKAKTVGNIAGFATSIPELFTVTLASISGLASTSLYNIISSNVINLIQYLATVIINKNTKVLKNKALIIDLIIVLITIAIPLYMINANVKLGVPFAIFLVILFLFFYKINSNAHKLYLEKYDKEIEEEFEQAVITQDIDMLLKKDIEFHECIFKAANNKKLEKMINTLWEQVQRFRITYVSDSNASLSLIDEHQSILNAIKEGNIADSKKFAIKHIEKAEQFMLEHCTK